MNWLKRCWLVAALAALCLPLAGSAGLTRAIVMDGGSRVAVELSWAFDQVPSACLILEERVPAGWRLDGYRCGGADVAVRELAGSVSFAIGLLAAGSARGSLTYWLVPVSDPVPVMVAGTWRTLFDTTPASAPIAGESAPAVVDPFAEWATAMGLSPGTDPEADPDADGFSNYAEYVAQTDPRDAQSRFQVTAWRVTPADQGLSIAWLGATNRDVYLDWRPAAGPSTDWRCVWTSTPPDRAARRLAEPVNGVVLEAPPIAPQPGFYRLRIAEP
ncbi:MAG: hypothetical protein GX590_02230 [Lentisphaerae bacterium]|nr:hypothetical protein [Lentisphaerota bacterium]